MRTSPAGRAENGANALCDDLGFAGFQRFGCQRDPLLVLQGNRDPGISLPQVIAQLAGGDAAAGWIEFQNEPGQRLTSFVRERPSSADARYPTEVRYPGSDRVLAGSHARFMIESEVSLHRREQTDQLFAAHLEGSAELVVWGTMEGDRLDQLGTADDQSGRLRPGQVLATAENRQIGSQIAREAPEVLGRWKLGRSIDDDRDIMRMGARHDLLERLSAACQVRSGDVYHGHGAFAER